MTQQEKQEIDKKCDEFCEYRRTHSNGYAPREWFMAGAKALDELRKPSEPETNVGEAGENVSKQAIIARLKRIGFTRMDEPNHYANDLGLSFTFDQNSKYSIANSNGYILISTDDVFDAFKLLQPDKELLEALKKICRVAPSYIKNPDDELDNAICEAMLAVYNYEKQGK